MPPHNASFSLRRFAVAAFCTLVLTAPLIHATRTLAGASIWNSTNHPKTVRQPNLIILKSKRIVYLFDGDVLVRSYGCDLGSDPLGDKRRVGDGKTPLGLFHIVSKNYDSPYRHFLGLDYPHRPAVAEGIATGLISEGAATSILNALHESRCPDWSTALGGGIGIHGHRQGRDWTGGCIAVSNRAIDELFNLLRIGDPVEILP